MLQLYERETKWYILGAYKAYCSMLVLPAKFGLFPLPSSHAIALLTF